MLFLYGFPVLQLYCKVAYTAYLKACLIANWFYCFIAFTLCFQPLNPSTTQLIVSAIPMVVKKDARNVTNPTQNIHTHVIVNHVEKSVFPAPLRLYESIQ
jgi:hypothetical protein